MLETGPQGRLLVDDRGFPVVPQALLTELKQINARLGASFHKATFSLIVTLDWSDDDSRRALVRDGQLAPETAYEILLFIPPHVRLDEIVEYAKREITRVSTQRDDIRRMVEDSVARTQLENEERIEKKAQAIVDDTFTGTALNIDVGKRRTKIKSIP